MVDLPLPRVKLEDLEIVWTRDYAEWAEHVLAEMKEGRACRTRRVGSHYYFAVCIDVVVDDIGKEAYVKVIIYERVEPKTEEEEHYGE